MTTPTGQPRAGGPERGGPPSQPTGNPERSQPSGVPSPQATKPESGTHEISVTPAVRRDSIPGRDLPQSRTSPEGTGQDSTRNQTGVDTRTDVTEYTEPLLGDPDVLLTNRPAEVVAVNDVRIDDGQTAGPPTQRPRPVFDVTTIPAEPPAEAEVIDFTPDPVTQTSQAPTSTAEPTSSTNDAMYKNYAPTDSVRTSTVAAASEPVLTPRAADASSFADEPDSAPSTVYEAPPSPAHPQWVRTDYTDGERTHTQKPSSPGSSPSRGRTISAAQQAGEHHHGYSGKTKSMDTPTWKGILLKGPLMLLGGLFGTATEGLTMRIKSIRQDGKNVVITYKTFGSSNVRHVTLYNESAANLNLTGFGLKFRAAAQYILK